MRDRAAQLGAVEVIALEEKGLSCDRGEGVAEAVAEVEMVRMTGAAAVVAIGLAHNLGLHCGDRLDRNFDEFDECVGFPAKDGLAPAVNHDGHLKVAGS